MPDDNGAAAPPARLEELRALVDDALRGDCAATAVWYADKLATLSRGAVEDELRLARAYAAGGDPARASEPPGRGARVRGRARAPREGLGADDLRGPEAQGARQRARRRELLPRRRPIPRERRHVARGAATGCFTVSSTCLLSDLLMITAVSRERHPP